MFRLVILKISQTKNVNFISQQATQTGQRKFISDLPIYFYPLVMRSLFKTQKMDQEHLLLLVKGMFHQCMLHQKVILFAFSSDPQGRQKVDLRFSIKLQVRCVTSETRANCQIFFSAIHFLYFTRYYLFILTMSVLEDKLFHCTSHFYFFSYTKMLSIFRIINNALLP